MPAGDVERDALRTVSTTSVLQRRAVGTRPARNCAGRRRLGYRQDWRAYGETQGDASGTRTSVYKPAAARGSGVFEVMITGSGRAHPRIAE